MFDAQFLKNKWFVFAYEVLNFALERAEQDTVNFVIFVMFKKKDLSSKKNR